MKNNASFLIVTATAVAALALCFGRIADFNAAESQVATVATPATTAAPATDVEAATSLRLE